MRINDRSSLGIPQVGAQLDHEDAEGLASVMGLFFVGAYDLRSGISLLDD